MTEPEEFSSPERVARIAGPAAVTALFRKDPERILRFFYEERMIPEVGQFCAAMARLHRPYRMVDAEELARIAGTVLHGGMAAVAEPRPVLPFDPAEAKRWAEAGQSLVILDGVGNPHNLGAIARTLAFFGFEHLLLSEHPAQAGLSDAAYRVAEGGLEYVQVYRADPLTAALKRIKPDYRVVGTGLGRSGLPMEALRDDSRPVALILGNEEHGLPRSTLEGCDAVITLRGMGRVQSLNVSATAAILAHALRPRPRSAAPDPRKTATPVRKSPARPGPPRSKRDPGSKGGSGF